MRAALLLFVVASATANLGYRYHDPNYYNVDAARAAHLAEVQRITGERLGALNAALARGPGPYTVVAPGVAPQPVVDNPDVDIARQAHLAEVARQTGAALAALARAPPAPYGGIVVPPPVPQGPPRPVVDNPDVALARQAHLAEAARQNGAALAALAQARARDGGVFYLPEAPDVALARQAHLAEHARINAARVHGKYYHGK